jgi:hypothetical protein
MHPKVSDDICARGDCVLEYAPEMETYKKEHALKAKRATRMAYE